MEDKASVLKMLESGNLDDATLKKIKDYVKNSDMSMDHQEPVMNLQKQLWAEGETKGWTKEQTMREINDALGESIHYAEKQIKDLSTENSELRDSIREFRQNNINDYVEDLYDRQVMVNEVYDKGELLNYIEKLDAGDEPMSGPLLGFLGRIDNFTAPDAEDYKEQQMGEDEDDEDAEKYVKDKASKKIKMGKDGNPMKMANYLESLTAIEAQEVYDYVEKRRLIRSMDMNEQTEDEFEKDFEEDFGSHKGDKEEEKVVAMDEHDDEDKEKVSVKVKVKSDKDSDNDKEEDEEDYGEHKKDKMDMNKDKKKAPKEGEEVDMEYTQTNDNVIGQDDNIPSETTDMHEQALKIISDNPSMDYVEALKTVVSNELK